MSNNIQTKTVFHKDKEAETLVVKTYNDVPSFNVGDTVRVYDGSYNTDAATNEKRYGIDPLFKYNPATVKAVKCDRWYQFYIGKDTIINARLDLLLEFPEGQMVYCSSICVNSITQKDFAAMLNSVDAAHGSVATDVK